VTIVTYFVIDMSESAKPLMIHFATFQLHEIANKNRLNDIFLIYRMRENATF